jgi:hypothetical protein
LIRFSIYSDLKILKNSRNRKCEKETAKKQTAKKKKKADEHEMGQAHDQLERERPGKKNARKQSNGPGPVTIGVCGAGFAPIRVEYRSSQIREITRPPP